MRLLFFGDITGRPARRALGKTLSKLRRTFQADMVIANAENAAGTAGITPGVYQELRDSGIDVLTLGDHSWDKKEVFDLIGRRGIRLIRPANWPPGAPGKGEITIRVGERSVRVLNLLGHAFIRPYVDDVFRTADRLLARGKTKVVIVDFHAEATGEKQALGWYLDGKVSAVLGTHTHVQTADQRILPKGTAYISDVGMVGAYDSVIGLDIATIIERNRTQLPAKAEPAKGPVLVSGVYLEIDEATGKAGKIERLQEIVE